MARNYSAFFSSGKPETGPKRQPTFLQSLGWQSFFAQQTSADELSETPPVRVVEVHRNALHVLGDGIDAMIPPGSGATVGDWLLLDGKHPPSCWSARAF